MTKRKRTEIELANPTPEVNSRADTTELIVPTGVDANAPREELMVVVEPVSEQVAGNPPLVQLLTQLKRTGSLQAPFGTCCGKLISSCGD